MRRMISAILSLLMVVALATACSSDTSTSTSGGEASASGSQGGGESQSSGEEAVPIRVALFTDGNDMSETQRRRRHDGYGRFGPSAGRFPCGA